MFKSLSHQKDISWCPTPDCVFAFVYDAKSHKSFTCNLCKIRYCLECRVEYHEGRSCKQYRDGTDEDFSKFAVGQKYKQCPGCRYWVSKNEGCDHMTCRCGEEFCYQCGRNMNKCTCNDSDSNSSNSDYDSDE